MNSIATPSLDVRKEVITLLQDLIRIDTTNPPGNEAEAAEYLARTLEGEGFECMVLESAPGRGNLITRLEGSEEGPSLLLLSHLDVVAANPDEWSVNPYSGVIREGYVWGRGALDMKSMVAQEVMVMKLLKRGHLRLRGDVILAATADEEMGGKAGVRWLLENHPESIKADYVINEGGGYSIPIRGRHIFTVQVAEKGVNWIRIRAGGRPGHGSVPGAADNAVLRMVEAINRVGRHRSRIKAIPTARRFINEVASKRGLPQRILTSLLFNPILADHILDLMKRREPGIAEGLRAMLRTTIAPTIIKGGVKENVIPSECEAVLDCRTIPGQSNEDLIREIKGILAGIDKLEIEPIQLDEPSESPIDTPLFNKINETLKELVPNSSIIPFMSTGGTDSRHLRRRGSICYGFHPLKTDMPLDEIQRMAHGVDERISIENLVFGTEALYRLVVAFMAE
ncbi:MAG: M20/M25/M40 family metallo-hydrolase [Candidatus Bathyarchaeia archaeon]